MNRRPSKQSVAKAVNEVKAHVTVVADVPSLADATILRMLTVYVKMTLEQAQAAYIESHGSVNTWTQVLRAMLVYQQSFAIRDDNDEQLVLLSRIRTAPLYEWGEIVVDVATGRSISEVLESLS